MRINLQLQYLLALTLLALSLSVQAQRGPRRFGAGILLGATASQINGDLSAGYNKLGVNTGLRGITRLNQRTDLQLEILYAQRGAQTELLRDPDNPFGFSLTLNYIEVPVMWSYKDWLIEGDDERDDYYRVAFNIGLSYARFLGAKSKDDLNALAAVAPDYLKKNDVSFLLGANFFATRHIGFSFRYVRSIGFMYDPRDWPNPPYQRAWHGHCLYFQAGYFF